MADAHEAGFLELRKYVHEPPAIHRAPMATGTGRHSRNSIDDGCRNVAWFRFLRLTDAGYSEALEWEALM